MFAPNRARRALAAIGLAFAVLAATVGCTTTQAPDAEKYFVPDELAPGVEVGTYGVIEEDHADYEWTGRRYEDGRFAGELDQSPLNGSEDYRPITSESSELEPSAAKPYGSVRKARVTKASKGTVKTAKTGKTSKKKRR